METLATCIPGCAAVETVVEGKVYNTRIKRRVGPFPLNFNLDITVAESKAPEFIAVEVSGSDRQLKSHVRERVSVLLSDAGDGRTRIEIATKLNITGLLASLSKSLISMHARQVLDEFVTTVRERVEVNCADGRS